MVKKTKTRCRRPGLWPGRASVSGRRRRGEGFWYEIFTVVGVAGFVIAVVTLVTGCATGRVNLAAADAVEMLSGDVALAIAEYQEDLDACDAIKLRELVEAYTNRIRHVETDAEIGGHQVQFLTALERVEADQKVAQSRKQKAENNLETMREIAAGLRRMGIESLKLDSEAQTYVEGLIEAAQKQKAESDTQNDESQMDPENTGLSHAATKLRATKAGTRTSPGGRPK